MREAYEVWVDGYHGDFDQDQTSEMSEPVVVFAWSEADAAECFVDTKFSDFDYPEETDVRVRLRGTIETTDYTVTVEQAPVFTAIQKEPVVSSSTPTTQSTSVQNG